MGAMQWVLDALGLFWGVVYGSFPVAFIFLRNTDIAIQIQICPHGHDGFRQEGGHV